jgi:glutathione S-transferase
VKTLLTIPTSHFCEKARWALDYHKLPYTEIGHLPLFHMLPARLRGGRSVPILVDGATTLIDSTDILAHLESQSNQPLFWDDPLLKKLEDRFDTALGPATRRIAYHFLFPYKELALELSRPGASSIELSMMKLFYPFAERWMRQGMKIDDAGAARSEAKLEEVLLEVDTLLQDGRPYLTGERFSAADLTFAALLSPLLQAPEHPRYQFPNPPPALKSRMDAISARPSGKHALTMYRLHRKSL